MTQADVRRAKVFVRERDGQRCTQCGMTAAEHKSRWNRTLEVHRLTPGSEYAAELCVTLCRSCHAPGPRSPNGSGHRIGNVRLVSIPPDMYDSLKELADEQFNSLTEQVKAAVREYLEKRDRLPKPPKPRA